MEAAFSQKIVTAAEVVACAPFRKIAQGTLDVFQPLRTGGPGVPRWPRKSILSFLAKLKSQFRTMVIPTRNLPLPA
jgi:hypothetical protein